MQPSKDCLELTEKSEGCRLKSYQDAGGVWTIGYGHTKGVKAGQTITQEIAESFLKLDIQYAVSVVNAHCLPCTQGQFDALTDFVFNVGPTQLLSSHLFAYHKSRAYEKAAAEFPKWKYDNGKIEPGLVTRRGLEQSLYTRQESEADHQHTDASGYSDQSTAYEPPSNPYPMSSLLYPAPPAQPSQTAQASNSKPVESLFQALASASKLISSKLGLGKS